MGLGHQRGSLAPTSSDRDLSGSRKEKTVTCGRAQRLLGKLKITSPSRERVLSETCPSNPDHLFPCSYHLIDTFSERRRLAVVQAAKPEGGEHFL